MEHVVQSYVSSETFAGSVLVAHGSDVIVSKGYGLANVEWNIASTPSARFKVASTPSSSPPRPSCSSKNAAG